VEHVSTDSIYLAILKALRTRKKRKFLQHHIYGTGGASKKIVKHLEKIKLNKELIQKQLFY